jgi:hypothetical protein
VDAKVENLWTRRQCDALSRMDPEAICGVGPVDGTFASGFA